MDFGEFKLASKVLALNMHDQALMSWFLSGDTTGTGLLTEQMFIKLVEKEMMKMAKAVLVINKTEYSTMIVKLLVMILTLICLLVFILLGWHSLGMSGGFAAGTGSTILASVGKLMGELGGEDEDDNGGGNDGGGNDGGGEKDGGGDGSKGGEGNNSGNNLEQTEAALDEVVLMFDADN